ncbi:ABC transporter related protein [Segniliparus rotundus DSM 44985]|uniref:ABC transporter related protein n=1 Tax=Segniliparus rotundus (strain ATCC BAA-972 / CDC 1076 / CIP 108378 / DSM 44985 / JCM 13578) TaxID=640132 RepID=D6Z806_SEGRD|nr:ABC transporter ATP-binding protein [Segniliparus rotundus]ADG98086.1 ABC transporter related protein [Segniliparus rotundus DSM 44985]
MTKLVLDKVAKRHDGFLALDELSFEVAAGEFFVLVGPSGCGKSTLLDLLSGLLAPTSGALSLNGEAITGPGLDRGVTFQQYALLPWRTARGNVELGLEAKKLPRRQRRDLALQALRTVGLADSADRYPGQLSGGMRQRVAIARSLALDPEVLLMDEPFGALDAQTREGLQDQLLTIQRTSGKTIVFITHDIEEAVYLGNRVAVLTPRPGRIKQIFDIRLPQRDREASGGGEAVRSSAEFVRHRHEIWLALREGQEPSQEREARVA